MRSEEEILESLRQTFQEGIREGSIHTNPPHSDYMKDYREEQEEEREQPSPETTKTVPNNMQEQPNSPETTPTGTQPEMSFHELLLSGKTFTRNGVTFGPMQNHGPVSWNSGGGSEQKSSEPKPTSEPLPYRNQEAMEACMKRNSTLTEEKYKALAEFHGF